ncbi:MAG: hypothetical protein ACI4QE_05345, partial [Acutalibacteraceae bacterium]
MVTTLFIKDESKEKGLKKLFKYIKGDKIYCNIKRYGSIAIREMNYINRRNKINYQLLSKEIGMAKGKVICSRDYIFPKNSGIVRF